MRLRSGKTISDKTISDKTISGKTISDKTISDKTISDKTISGKDMKTCGHSCELWHTTCCACSDKRPKSEYYAYNQSLVEHATRVTREYYYCPTCKKRPKTPSKPIMETLTKKNTILLKNLEVKEEHIAALNNSIAALDMIRIEHCKNSIAVLDTIRTLRDKNTTELENKIQELKNEQQDYRGQTLCNSGMEELVYHLGFCSDVIGDCWLPHYKTSGLDALKAVLRNNSKYIHKGAPCEECKRLIDGIFD